MEAAKSGTKRIFGCARWQRDSRGRSSGQPRTRSKLSYLCVSLLTILTVWRSWSNASDTALDTIQIGQLFLVRCSLNELYVSTLVTLPGKKGTVPTPPSSILTNLKTHHGPKRLRDRARGTSAQQRRLENRGAMAFESHPRSEVSSPEARR